MASNPLKPGGIKSPGKYGYVGENYNTFGEQPGFTYDPQTDKYYSPEKWNIVSASRKQDQDAANAINNPKKPPGLFEQLGPVAGVAVAGKLGYEAAVKGSDKLFSGFGSSTPTTDPSGLLNVGGAQPVSDAAAGGGSVASPTITGVQRVPGQEAAAGSGLTSFQAPANGSIGQIAGGLAAAKGVYDTAKGYDNGGEGMRAGLTQVGAGLGGVFGSVPGSIIGAGLGNAVGYGLQGSGIKNDAALFAATGGIATPLIVARRLGVPIGGRVTLRQQGQKRTQNYLKEAEGDQAATDYINTVRSGYETGPADPSNPFFGQYKTWDEYKKAGLNAQDLSNVDGNLETFGVKDWAKLSSEQRTSVTQALINADLYDEGKAKVFVKDKDKAKQIYEDVISGKQPVTNVNAAQPAVPHPQQPGGLMAVGSGNAIARNPNVQAVQAAPQPVSRVSALPQPLPTSNAGQGLMSIGALRR